MILTQFLLKLYESDGDWSDSYGYIRNGDFCPVTEVCGMITGKWFDQGQTGEAGKLIGLDNKLRQQIVVAADIDCDGPQLQRLRRMLRWATGLTESANA